MRVSYARHAQNSTIIPKKEYPYVTVSRISQRLVLSLLPGPHPLLPKAPARHVGRRRGRGAFGLSPLPPPLVRGSLLCRSRRDLFLSRAALGNGRLGEKAAPATHPAVRPRWQAAGPTRHSTAPLGGPGSPGDPPRETTGDLPGIHGGQESGGNLPGVTAHSRRTGRGDVPGQGTLEGGSGPLKPRRAASKERVITKTNSLRTGRFPGGPISSIPPLRGIRPVARNLLPW